jgi:hypothetical protein
LHLFPNANNNDLGLETIVKTESINALSSAFECDRATLVKALRNVPADAEQVPGRPTWKISTAINALMAHRARNPRADSRRQHFNGSGGPDADWRDPVLMQLFAEEDEASANMRRQPTLDGRRKAAREMVPLLSRIYVAIRERGRANGLNPDATDYRADHMYLVGLRGFEKPCEWSEVETRSAMALEPSDE